jgi:hypothetical protein
VLSSQTDWDKLVFDGGLVGSDARDALPATTRDIEPSRAEEDVNEQFFAAYFAGRNPTPNVPGGGQGGAPGGSTSAAARLTGLKVRPRAFRAPRRGKPIVKRGGAKVTYRLDRATTVVFTVERRAGSRWRRVPGSFRHAGKAGANGLRISGRVANKRLRPGRHRLVATPQGGAPVRAAFAVRR